MIIRIAACLLAVGFLAACESTSITKRETVREMTSHYAAGNPNLAPSREAAPPAEGPEEANGDLDPEHDPALVPSPLLRASAAGSL